MASAWKTTKRHQKYLLDTIMSRKGKMKQKRRLPSWLTSSTTWSIIYPCLVILKQNQKEEEDEQEDVHWLSKMQETIDIRSRECFNYGTDF